MSEKTMLDKELATKMLQNDAEHVAKALLVEANELRLRAKCLEAQAERLTDAVNESR